MFLYLSFTKSETNPPKYIAVELSNVNNNLKVQKEETCRIVIICIGHQKSQ